MDAQSKETFEAIVSREPFDLTEGQKSFLRARSSYLSDDQAKKFADVLKVTPTEDGNDDASDITKMKLDELKEEAVKRNVDISGLTTKKEILEAIQNAQA